MDTTVVPIQCGGAEQKKTTESYRASGHISSPTNLICYVSKRWPQQWQHEGVCTHEQGEGLAGKTSIALSSDHFISGLLSEERAHAWMGIPKLIILPGCTITDLTIGMALS